MFKFKNFKFINIIYLLAFFREIVSKEEPLITGGYRPESHTLAKYVVYMEIKTKDSKYFSCGGAILSRTKVLTAAHCLESVAKPDGITVYYGCVKRSDCYKGSSKLKAREYFVHPEFNSKTLEKDVAVISLKGKMKLDGTKAASINLVQALPSAGATCTVLGWGSVFEDGPGPDEILYVDLYVFSTERCERIDPQIDKCVFCAGDKSDLTKGSCQGDSGGPLICDEEVAGVVSYGFGCSYHKDAADFYTDISCYLDWINENKAGSLLANSFMVILLAPSLVLKTVYGMF